MNCALIWCIFPPCEQSLVEELPELYKLHVPRLNLLSSPEVRQPGKAPNYSVNWAKGNEFPEVIDAMKGKEQVSKPAYGTQNGLTLLFILIVVAMCTSRWLKFGLVNRTGARSWVDGVFFEKFVEDEKKYSFSNFSKKRSRKKRKIRKKLFVKLMNFCEINDNSFNILEIFTLP